MAAWSCVVSMERLSLANLKEVVARSGISPPQPSRDEVTTGIVHLGIGAFHRAHQAVFTSDAMAASGVTEWGIVGVTQRSPTVRSQLVPQNGLYTLWEKGVGAASPRVMGLHTDVVAGADDPAAVAGLLASPEVRVVTLTITEKGYRMKAGYRLHTEDEVVAADLAGALAAGRPCSAVGQLVAGLVRRASVGAPLTVLSCDNLPENGRVLAGLVRECYQAAGLEDRVGEFVESSVSFPCSMVDRIVPATTDADRADAFTLLGVEDRALVVAEPFRQWVIEDAFAADRPAWERAGAVITPEVAPWEKAKLRLLNGSHSLLAYAGALAGFSTIAAAICDEQILQWVVELQAEQTATLEVPHGLDIDQYRSQLLERFANPALPHTTFQVAMDGSQKLPQRLVAPLREQLAFGHLPNAILRALAAWMAFVALGHDVNGAPLPLDDPLADRLRASTGDGSATAVVRGLLGMEEVIDAELREDARVKDALIELVGEFGVGR